MNKSSPSELRKIEKGITSFNHHWYIDKQTSEIRHKKLSGSSKFLDFFWRRKHAVSDLYWWISRNWSNTKMMDVDTPIKHDDVSIKGFPRKYQLENNWTIPEDDLKYLYNGPLVDESGHLILVKHQSNFQNTISFISQLRPLTWIISFILICYRYRNDIVELWNWVISLINQ